MGKVLEVFSARLESLVRQYPEQWYWWHRRWRRRPGIDYQSTPELLRSTAEYITWLENDAAREVDTANQHAPEQENA